MIDPSNDRYPYCIVWTPIPLLSWFMPFIGHMGIADSHGIIHDFAGPYYVSVDAFAFGAPTRYLPLNPQFIQKRHHQQVQQQQLHAIDDLNDSHSDNDDNDDDESNNSSNTNTSTSNTTEDNDNHHHHHHHHHTTTTTTNTQLLAKSWDNAIEKTRRLYKKKMYNFFLNNCHHFVQCCLNEMQYEDRNNWGIVELGTKSFLRAHHVDTYRTVKTYAPFVILILLSLLLLLFVFFTATSLS